MKPPKVHSPSHIPALLSLVISIRAITLGRHVFVRHQVLEHLPEHQRLLRHEAAHVGQWDDLGALAFLWWYVSDFAVCWWRLRDRRVAYRAIRLEQDARAWAADYDGPWQDVALLACRWSALRYQLPPKR